ncbi:MAG: translation initiation factor IF-3 [Chitinophagales bacterium]|nr:translation initiation factor IF-3 [Bacteroidota bacterium]MCB9043195.1 translation initiation factor IF-3 [Chitinophagales bacterium]
MAKRRYYSPPTPEHNINQHIRAKEVRLVGDNVEQGIYTIQEALRLAEEEGLDLVEISPNANPPVCRLIEYQKFLYEKKKKEKEIKAKTAKTVIKEIRFTPHTDDHDFEFKSKHAEKFLQEGSKVRAYVQFRGRAIVFKDQGTVLLSKFIERLEEVGVVDQAPKLEGKRMYVTLSPKNKK